ncbi:MAG: hypothetical protein RSD85_00560, partial [Erysipelotrichaceae bacterium]
NENIMSAIRAKQPASEYKVPVRYNYMKDNIASEYAFYYSFVPIYNLVEVKVSNSKESINVKVLIPQLDKDKKPMGIVQLVEVLDEQLKR